MQLERQPLWQWRSILSTAPSVAVLVLVLRQFGGLQLLEYAALDRFFRWRPAEPTDSRVVIVTIDESDIVEIGQWPVPDRALARALQNLHRCEPRAIGLDIYRDLPVEPGHQELQQAFRTIPNLIGIQKVIGDGQGPAVAPPPLLQKLDRVAAADLVLDADGKLRRALLSLRDRERRTIPGLGTRLAMLYLAAEGIVPQAGEASPQHIRLGRARFEPLEAHDGGYVNVPLGGYQILANFHRMPGAFPVLSFSDAHAGNFPKDLVSDRIVLIGLRAESYQDRFYTPYSNSLETTLSGVEIHADLASQIVSAAIDGRPIFRFWPEALEWVWIMLWSVVGALLGGSRLVSPAQTMAVVVVLAGGLVAFAYSWFLAGWWIALVPELLALAGAATASAGHRLWSDLQASYMQLAFANGQLTDRAKTLAERVADRTAELDEKNRLLQQEVETRTEAQSQLELSLQEKEVLLKEVYHRVKNNLQIISSLFSLQSEYVRDPRALSILEEGKNRVRAMALIHQNFYQLERLSEVDLEAYVSTLVRELLVAYQAQQRVEIDLSVEDCGLSLDTAILCGLLLNESISNAIEHGFPNNEKGRVCIDMFPLNRETYCLRVCDNGIGLPADFDLNSKRTLGIRLTRALTRQLKGELKIASQDGYTCFEIQFPKARVNPQERP